MAKKTNRRQIDEGRKLLGDFRKQYGLTLVELAKASGLSFSMLGQFERGDRDLSPKAWTRVLAALGKLLTEDEERRRAELAKASEIAAKLGVLAPILTQSFRPAH